MDGSKRKGSWVRRGLISAAVLVVLAVLAVWLVPSFIDLERFRGTIESEIEKASGWQTRLGELDLSFDGGFLIRAEPVELAEGDGEGSTVEIPRLELRVGWRSLLSLRFDVERIVLHEPRLKIVTGEDDAESEGDPELGETEPDSQDSSAAMEIGVQNGRLQLVDQATGASILDCASFTGTFELSSSTVVGDLVVRSLLFSGGERPIERAELGFDVVERAGEWIAERLEIRAGATRIQGSGPVYPRPRIRFSVDDSPLEAALAFAAGLVTLPIAPEGPGSLDLSFLLATDEEERLSVSAEGRARAAGIDLGPPLPPAEALDVSFRLSPDGALTLDSVSASVAGGTLSGVTAIDRIDPPGLLRFEGRLDGGDMGRLLAPLVVDATGRVSGDTSLGLAVALDLSKPDVADGLRGELTLDASALALPGWDFERALRGRLLGAAEEEEKPGLEERIDRLAFVVGMAGGPWSIDSISLETADVSVTGRGRFDPTDASIDFELALVATEEKSQELVEDHGLFRHLRNEQRRVVVPFEVEGSVLAPRFDFDTSAALRNRLGPEKPKEKLKDLLRGLVDRELQKR